MVRIIKKNVYWTIVFLLLFKPDFIEYMGLGNVDKLIDFLRIFIVFGAIINFFYMKEKEAFVLAAAFFQLPIIVSTIIYKGDIRTALVYAASYVTVVILSSQIYKNKSILKGMYSALGIYIFFNLLSILIFPNGMYLSREGMMQWNWIIGYKTEFPIYLIPFICISLLEYMRTKEYKYIFYFFLAGCQPFIVWTVGAMICVSAIGAGYFLCKRESSHIRKYISVKIILILFLIANILLVGFNAYKSWGWLITSVFKKDITLSKREYIWRVFLEAIKESPIFGYGNEYDAYTLSKTAIAPYAHNYLLNLIYISGTFGAMCFLLFLIWLANKTTRDKGKDYYLICTICLGGFLVGCLFESWEMLQAIPLLFALIYYGNRIFEGGAKDERSICN